MYIYDIKPVENFLGSQKQKIYKVVPGVLWCFFP